MGDGWIRRMKVVKWSNPTIFTNSHSTFPHFFVGLWVCENVEKAFPRLFHPFTNPQNFGRWSKRSRRELDDLCEFVNLSKRDLWTLWTGGEGCPENPQIYGFCRVNFSQVHMFCGCVDLWIVKMWICEKKFFWVRSNVKDT